MKAPLPALRSRGIQLCLCTKAAEKQQLPEERQQPRAWPRLHSLLLARPAPLGSDLPVFSLLVTQSLLSPNRAATHPCKPRGTGSAERFTCHLNQNMFFFLLKL